jgi:hypothetical protein
MTVSRSRPHKEEQTKKRNGAKKMKSKICNAIIFIAFFVGLGMVGCAEVRNLPLSHILAVFPVIGVAVTAYGVKKI